MDKQLEERINELGKILNLSYLKNIGSHEAFMGMGSGDGHSFDDRPIYETVTDYKEVYVHSQKERKKAREELKWIRREYKDNNIRRLVEEQFKPEREKFKLGLKSILRGVLGAGITLALITSAIYFPIKGCVREEKIKKGKPVLFMLESYKQSPQGSFGNIVYGDYIKGIGDDVEKGKIILPKKHYEEFREYFGNYKWFSDMNNFD